MNARSRDLLIRSGFTALLAALLAATPAAAQHGAPMPSAKVEFPAGADSVRVPFESSMGHIVLPISVNGSEPIRVVLDTGMPMPGLVLFSGEATAALGLDLKQDPGMQVGGAGGDGEHFQVRSAGGASLDVGGLKLSGVNVMALPPISHFKLGHAGIIGADILRNATVELDHDAGEMILWKPGTYKPKPGSSSVDLTLRQGLPFVETTLVPAGGKQIPLEVVMDLGATHPISLNATTDEGIVLPGGAIATSIGRGLSGDVTGHVGRVNGLKLGGFLLENVVATFPAPEHENPRGIDSLNGNLGMGILTRFNLAIDYASEKMYLTPARSFDEPFEWDMSGITSFPADEGVEVAGVLSGSPAEKAGLKKGDLLLEVDGKPIRSGDLDWFKKKLRHDGTEIEVVYQRGGSKESARIQLRRLI